MVTKYSLLRYLRVAGWLVVLSAVLLSSGCQFLAPAPTPTNTALPSNTAVPTDTATPLPTDTPVPTDTPTPIPTDTPVPTNTPTITPDRAATQAAASTATAEVVIADIREQLAAVGAPTDVGYLGWLQERALSIDVSGAGDYVYDPFAEDLEASDFVISTDVTWEATNIVICGMMFRSEPNFEQGKQYQLLFLRFSGLPAWAIEYYRYGEFQKSVTTVKFSDYLDLDNGATNHLVMWAEGGKFTIYINDTRVGDFYDYSESAYEGYFAFFAGQDAGQSTCTFDNTWVWLLK